MLALAAARCSRGVQLTRLSRGKARQVSDDAATKIKNLELEIKKLEHAAKMEELAATHALELKKLEMIRNANRGLFEKMGLKSETAKTEIGEKITPLQKTEKFVHSILSGAGHFPKEGAQALQKKNAPDASRK